MSNALTGWAEPADAASWDWSKNSFGQYPCEAASRVFSSASTSSAAQAAALFAPLPDGYSYNSPGYDDTTVGQDYVTLNQCLCSVPGYSIVMACTSSQGRSVEDWASWTTQCSNSTIVGSLGGPINYLPIAQPADSDIPKWAFIPITTSAWDLDGARTNATNEALALSTDTSSSTSTTTSTSSTNTETSTTVDSRYTTSSTRLRSTTATTSTASTSTSTNSSSPFPRPFSDRTAVILGIVVPVLLVGTVIAIVVWRNRRKRRLADRSYYEVNDYSAAYPTSQAYTSTQTEAYVYKPVSRPQPARPARAPSVAASMRNFFAPPARGKGRQKKRGDQGRTPGWYGVPEIQEPERRRDEDFDSYEPFLRR
ncbi:hypothetical protein BT69DRAFT_1323655 [Atractiella rhizophila]|nr:hypothetical protein BT69DRAFT_1323655 [Atractiella rhizophila]